MGFHVSLKATKLIVYLYIFSELPFSIVALALIESKQVLKPSLKNQVMFTSVLKNITNYFQISSRTLPRCLVMNENECIG